MSTSQAERSLPERAPPVERTSERTPAERTPAERMPAERMPAERMPAERMPAERMPAERIPAERMPAERMPAERMPAERMPAERMPAERMPAERMPAERMPAERLPAERMAERSSQSAARAAQVRDSMFVLFRCVLVCLRYFSEGAGSRHKVFLLHQATGPRGFENVPMMQPPPQEAGLPVQLKENSLLMFIPSPNMKGPQYEDPQKPETLGGFLSKQPIPVACWLSHRAGFKL